MANVKISELVALTSPAAADELPVVDVSATSTKKTTVGEIVGIINGDVEVASNGTATISELPVSKLQDGAARQLLQTDAAGTGVEWTSNIDVPGTLDVTGAATLDSTLTVPLGSAAAPTLRFTGDTNTGIYSPGADQVAISTNGTGRLFVDASGVVDIYNSTPKLGFSSVGSFYNWIECGGVAGDNYMRFATANTERMRLDSSGRLGLGTSSPQTPLQIAGGTDNANLQDYITFSRTGYPTANFRQVIAASAGSDPSQNNLVFKISDGTNAAEERVRITGSGRVGVGTTSPQEELHISSASNPYIQVQGTGTTAGSAYYGWNSATGSASIESTGSIRFAVPGLEAARIDSSGRLLVGTTTVGSGGTLSVNGTISVGGGSSGSQAEMSKVGMQFTSSIASSATTIFTSVIQGLSGGVAGAHLMIYGSNNAGASFMDVVVTQSGGTVVVISSSTLEGSPAARTYTMSSASLQLQMASGTFNTNVRCTSMGYPF